MNSTEPANIPTWSEGFRALHDALCQARVSTSPSAADILQHQLQLNRKKFLNLLDDAPKDNQARSTLQGGRAYIDHRAHKVNEDFVKDAIFLSNQLNVNEHVAATLLMKGMTESTRVNTNPIDTAILLYHNEREYLLASLDVILNSCKDSSVREDVRFVFRQFAAELLYERVPLDNKPGASLVSFAEKILHTTKVLHDAINTLTSSGTIQQQQQTTTVSTTGVNQSGSVTGGRLGEDITAAYIEHLQDQRIYLAQIIYHLASMFWLDGDDVLKLTEMLEQSKLSDMIAPYLLLTLVAAISIRNHSAEEFQYSIPLYRNETFLKKMHERLSQQLWKVPAVKGVVVLQWVLFLSLASQIDGSIESRLPAKEEELEELVEGAVGSKAFEFMNDYLLYFQQPCYSIDTDRGLFKTSVYENVDTTLDGLTVDPSDFTKFNADIRPDFRQFVVYELEQLTDDFIENLQNTLRKLKYKEEDSSSSFQQHSVSRITAATTSDEELSPCRDLEAFYNLLATIYRYRINSGWKFWDRGDSRLFAFIKWTTDIKVQGTVCACYDFLASISTGHICAHRAFNYLDNGTNRSDLASSGLFSWGKLFAALQFYVPLVSGAGDDSQATIPLDEEALLRSFLYLLEEVVQYSSEARIALYQDNVLRAVPTIIEVLSCRTPIELRASLYNVLAAFCSPWGGGVENVGRTIAGDMWRALEKGDFFVPKPEVDFSVQQQELPGQSSLLQRDQRKILRRRETQKQPGYLRELARERLYKSYPETLAILNLFASAIHTKSRREDLLDGFAPSISTVPWDLGKGTRTPGAAPYISLVIDHIFLALESQEYMHPGSRWQLAELCLKVLENSVQSFDLQPLEERIACYTSKMSKQIPSYTLALQGKGNVPSQLGPVEDLEGLVLSYLAHPGFTIFVRMLSGDRLVPELLKIVERGPDGVMAKQEKSPYFIECVVRSLRIIKTVLDKQDAFSNLLVPAINNLSNKASSSELGVKEYTISPLPSLVPFGQLMLYHANSIVQVARLVNCEDKAEICFLSTKILEALSSEPNESKRAILGRNTRTAMGGLGVKLTGVLQGCKDEAQILYGFSERIGIDDAGIMTADDYEYDINNIPFWMATKTLQDKYNLEAAFQPRMSCSVRLAIIDMLLKNSSLEKPTPSLSDFVLGYSTSSWATTTPQGSEPAEKSLICFKAILDLMRQGIPVEGTEETSETRAPLIATHPILAEKCYQLIYKLCAKVSTSATTMRYLRSKERFFYDHFKALPARVESYPQVTAPVFPGLMLCSDGSRTKIDFFSLRSQLHQRAWLLKSIALELHMLANTGQTSEIKRMLELLYGQGELRLEEDGMDMDLGERNIFSLRSSSMEQPLVKMLEIVSSLEFDWRDDLAAGITQGEFKYFKGFDPEIYETENDYQCTLYDIRGVYKVLRNQQAALFNAGEIANDQDNNALEEEMSRILHTLMVKNHLREIAAGKLHCLRAWKQVVQVTLSECFDLLPAETREKIIYALISTLLPKMRHTDGTDADILKGFSEVILTLLTRLLEDKQRQELLEVVPAADVRLAAPRLPDEKLRAIFIGIIESILQEGTTIAVRGDMYTALVNFLRYVSYSNDQTVKVESQFLELADANEKFLDILCTDASDGLNVWKTTAYIALDALYVLSNKAKAHAILSFLVRKNFLRYSIDMIRREDIELVGILEKPNASLVPLYIYEAKMSLLLRLALCKEGAKLLLENRIIDIFSHCHFLNARPESNLVNGDHPELTDSFIENYNRLLMPALKLMSALLNTIGRVNTVVLEKVEGWARKQQEMMLSILKDDQRQVTLPSLAQLKLATCIMYALSCRSGFFDDLATRGLHQLNTAMMQLVAKYLIAQNIASQVVPSSMEEREWENKHLNEHAGATSTSKLTKRAEQLVASIRMNLIAYARNAAFVTDKQGNSSFKPVFSNSLTSSNDEGGLVMQNVSKRTPSLSTLAACIRHTTTDLQSCIAERKLLQSQKNNVASLKFEEIREISESAFPQSLNIRFDHLSPSQQQYVLAIELMKRVNSKEKEIGKLLFILENVLLVLWRHLEFYMQPASTSGTSLDLYSSDAFGVSSHTAMFQPSITVASNLKSVSQSVLEPLLKKLETIEVNISSLQASVNSVHSLCQRIKQTIA